MAAEKFYDDDADLSVIQGKKIAGICYGSQLMAYQCGGRVETAPVSEYGRTDLTIDSAGGRLLADVTPETTCWMSHTDYIAAAPEGFAVTAHTVNWTTDRKSVV